VAVVAQSGGDYTSPLAAMADLANWCGAGFTPCLVKILPGSYNLGSQALVMAPGVDIEGSGEENTTISSTAGATSTTGTVVGANFSELRMVRVNNSGVPFARGVFASSVTGFRVTRVKVVVNQAFTSSEMRGIDLRQSSAVLSDVNVLADGLQTLAIGVANGSGDVVITDSTLLARTSHGFNAYGVLNYASSGSPGSVRLFNVSTRGAGQGIANVGLATGFANDCNGCFGWLEHVQSTGGTIGGPAVVNNAYGVWNNSAARLEITDSYLLGTFGSTDEAGIYNNSTAADALHLRNSLSDSGIASVANNSTGTIFLANNQLKGTLTGGAGTWNCIGNYDQTFAAKSCP
jgi:hypothetical protein